VQKEAPASYEEAAELLRACSDDGIAVRFAGAKTKFRWGAPVDAGIEVSTERLDAIIEHNEGDLTAVVQAGARLADLQRAFAEAGQMLAIDPPSDAATIGGTIATGDSGPLRQRYGTMRDLVVGMTVVLSDGTVSRSGGKVIKNVAGYDIGKLFTGAFGTLGMIAEVAVRLHPRPPLTVTVRSGSDDPSLLARAASALAHLPFEMDSLDLRWSDGAGEILARFGGAAPQGRADAAVRALRGLGAEATVEDDDDELWAAQRGGQRAREGPVLRVSALPTGIARVLSLAGFAVGRAGLGVLYLRVGGGDLVETIEESRRALRPFDVVVLDAPEEVRENVDVWGTPADGSWDLMRRIRARFDEAGICNPGIFGDSRVGI
jgi:glycolate dehydrogenase FAD-binding subunit